MNHEQFEYLERRRRALEDRRLALDSLCGRCKHAHIFRRAGKLTVDVYCTELNRPVPGDIVECNAYDDPRTLELWEMRQIAHLVDAREGLDDRSYL